VPRRTIILTSVLVGIVALIGGILGIASRSASYEATAEVSVVPKTTDPDLSISAVDTLSRGPVTSNFAEAYASSRVIDQAFRAAGISEAEADRVSVDASVVTDTSFVLVTATADQPVLAERAANAVAQVSPELGGYSAAFQTQVYDSADGTATRSGPGTATLVLIAIVVAAVLGVVTAALLGRLFRGPRGPGAPSGGGFDEPDVDVTINPRRARPRVTQAP
jgi:capsular polysaccharide biosynthesis protein